MASIAAVTDSEGSEVIAQDRRFKKATLTGNTEEKPYACQKCSNRFSLKGNLTRHMKTHTGIRPHMCPHCDKTFIQANGLKAHLFRHTGNGGFKCDICDKTFNRKARLEMHTIYVHTDERNFPCLDCDKKFARKEDLQRHAFIHTGEKSFKCGVCNKSYVLNQLLICISQLTIVVSIFRFAIKSSLQLHQLTHTREEPRSCEDCGRIFMRQDCLVRHMRNRHREKYMQMHSICVLPDKELLDLIKELLGLLVEKPLLEQLGWPDVSIDKLLESVIKECGRKPTSREDSCHLRENCKLFLAVVVDDVTIESLLNNHTVDEISQHVLKLAQNLYNC